MELRVTSCGTAGCGFVGKIPLQYEPAISSIFNESGGEGKIRSRTEANVVREPLIREPLFREP